MGFWLGIAASVVAVTAIILLVIAHFDAAIADPFFIYGALLLALAATLTVLSFTRNVIILLVIFLTLAFFLVAVYEFNFLSLRGFI